MDHASVASPSATRMRTLQITVHYKRAGRRTWPVSVEWRPDGDLPVFHFGELSLDLTQLRQRHSAEDYGQYLGEALFRDDIRDAFIEAARGSAEGLRVLLFVQDEELKALRWERLRAEIETGRWGFLALSSRFPYSLFIPSGSSRHYPPIAADALRAMVVVASPRSAADTYLEPFDVRSPLQATRKGLEPIPCDVLGFVESACGEPSLDALCERLTAQRYTILHVVCHGAFIAKRGAPIEKENVLYLAKGQNEIDEVDASRLISRLANIPPDHMPYLAFLAVCESGQPEANLESGALAHRLVAELGMPAVVAMTDEISLETAIGVSESFYRRLRVGGDVDRALVEATAKLAERPDITVPALCSRLGGLPLFSDVGTITNPEIERALTRFESLLAERAPVLRVPRFRALAARLRPLLVVPRSALDETPRRERDAAETELSDWCRRVLDIEFDAFARDEAPPAYDARCPFPGLYPFRVEDREFFFGRDELVGRVAAMLDVHRFVAVIGPSGGGKSSLVLAGLIPHLESMNPERKAVVMRPGRDPFGQLRASWDDADASPQLLVVDQFEEIFTQCADDASQRGGSGAHSADDVRKRFLDRVLQIAADVRHQVVLTMRAEFWEDILGRAAWSPYKELKALMERAQVLVAPMDEYELSDVITRQARQVRLRFEADLDDAILRDVRGEPGAMPLLQYALREIWLRRWGTWLLRDEYDAIGGLAKAIARTADDFLARRADEFERQLVQGIFVRLTHVAEAAGGVSPRDTRQRVRFDELVPIGVDRDRIKRLVDELATARLVMSGDGYVEVAHEALIRYWDALREWLRASREFALWRQRLRTRIQEWSEVRATRKDDQEVMVAGTLLRGAPLAEAQRWLKDKPQELNATEEAFIQASIMQRRKEEEQAERERERFKYQVGRFLATSAQSAFAEHPERALLLAVEAVRVSATSETEMMLRDLLRKTGGIPLRGHTGPVHSVAFDPKGRWLASGAEEEADGKILLWALDAPDQPPLALPNPECNLIASVAFDPLGRWLAAADTEGVSLWSLDDSPRRWCRLPSKAEVVAFAPDGAWLFAGTSDGCVQAWSIDASGRKAPKRWAATNKTGAEIRSIAVDAKRRWLAFANDGGEVWLWMLGQLYKNAKPSPSPRRLPDGDGYCVATDPEARWLVAGGGSEIRVWTTGALHRRPRVLREDSTEVESLAFDPERGVLLVGGQNGTMIPWLLEAGTSNAPVHLHELSIASIAVDSAGRWSASAGYDRAVRLMARDYAEREPRLLLPPLAAQFANDIAWDPRGRWLAVACTDGGVRLFSTDWEKRAPAKRLSGPSKGKGLVVAWDPTGRWLASVCAREVISLWLTQELDEPAQVLRPRQGRISDITFDSTGRWLASAGEDSGSAMLWRLDSLDKGAKPVVLAAKRKSERVVRLAFDPTDKWFAGTSATSVYLWEFANLEREPIVLPSWDEAITSFCVSFDPLGRWLAVAGNDCSVRLWSLAALDEPPISLVDRGLALYSSLGRFVAFDANGDYLASVAPAGSDSLLLFSVVGSTIKARTWLPLLAGGTHIAFDPLSRWLAAINQLGMVEIFSLDLKALCDKACSVAGRNLALGEWQSYFGIEEPYRPTAPELPLPREQSADAGRDLS